MGTVLTNKDLQELLKNFSVDQDHYVFRRIDQGFINDTFLVLKKGQPRYILQRINHEVFMDVAGVMGNMTKALNYLNDEDYSLVVLIPAKTTNSYYELNHEEFWRLMEYIPNSFAHDFANNSKEAYEAGRILGKFHLLMGNAPVDQFVDTIPKFHNLSFRWQQFQEALKNAVSVRRNKADTAISFAEKIMPRLMELSTHEMPLRPCHNDTKLNNILFSKTTNKALCFIDLDTLMKGHFYYDFGDLVRTIANTAKEDEKEHHKISFHRPLFESFLDGLASNGHFLTQDELKSLLLGTVLMPFIHGLRALTDYLNNDKYYTVSYADQNLDRSLSLFDFSKKALNELSYIEEIVAKKLKHTQY